MVMKMMGFGRKRELVERPKDEKKFDRHDPYDRNIILTMVITAAIVLALAVGFIILWYKM